MIVIVGITLMSPTGRANDLSYKEGQASGMDTGFMGSISYTSQFGIRYYLLKSNGDLKVLLYSVQHTLASQHKGICKVYQKKKHKGMEKGVQILKPTPLSQSGITINMVIYKDHSTPIELIIKTCV
ncbi:hypothetical protein RJT34_01665 [Clitoria ternatea]|uniref:Uncharacterized protein n=1 Tax=Clitoria ternatea TaxID=43366 RepID=A0AAN9PYM3_CLITE